MAGYFQAVALDLDGTLTCDGQPDGQALAAIGRARDAGVRVLLVTGRTLEHLTADFPGLAAAFDLVVAENGGVLAGPTGARPLAGPVEEDLTDALTRRGVTYRRGQVLLACAAAADQAALEEIGRLGLDCQLVRNRGELMILPAGVSKAQGLLAALTELGLSPHNTIAVGDAENDRAMLEASELGVAVANAVPALKAHADLVLDGTNGSAVAALLDGPLLTGEHRPHPRRRQVQLGTFPDGNRALVPSSQANVLVTGETGRGKSYLAGLLAERLLTAGYRLVVIDPEGDHIGLGALPDTLVLGGPSPLPDPRDIAHLLAGHGPSVIVNLSTRPPAEREHYVTQLCDLLETARTERGLPHWIILDEAHALLGRDGALRPIVDVARRGYCLITYQPQQLCPEVLATIDVALSTAAPLDAIVAPGSLPPPPAIPHGSALLVRADSDAPAGLFTLDRRTTRHRRHRHKYAEASLPPHRWFVFRGPDNTPGPRVGNLAEFVTELDRSDLGVIDHHLPRGDFSRWILDVLQDPELGARIAAIEREVADRHKLDLDRARGQIRDTIEQCYLTSPREDPTVAS